jgi:cell fate regulator YaaT (PSP1 superfamily)
MGCICNGCETRGITESNDGRRINISEGYTKLPLYDWMKETGADRMNIVEVRFKNTRKDFYINENNLPLKKGDVVAVEATLGFDIGTVSLTGNLVFLQMRKKSISPESYKFKKIYRRAKKHEIERWKEALALETPTMIKARKIIADLNLDMKLGDVEYQGDKTKAIFYYIADDRVDFRELIKILAAEFKVRIEMRQIGARQEAGRIGGIGSCGRELCCSTWKTNFQSIGLDAAKKQELPANAQKLAGQCGKLKCCLIYELDTYVEAQKDIPKQLLELETEAGTAYHQKTDILNKILYYAYEQGATSNLIPLQVSQVREIIQLNKKGVKVPSLKEKKALEFTLTEKG